MLPGRSPDRSSTPSPALYWPGSKPGLFSLSKMNRMHPAPYRASLAALFVLAPAPFAQSALADDVEGPIATALLSNAEDVQIYNDHVVTLANPFMEGRLPGTRGMEIATEYFVHYLQEAGLEPAFDEVLIAEDGTEVRRPRSSWTQPFNLGGSREVVEQHLSAGTRKFAAGTDFNVLGLGEGGDVTGELVFVGYSVERGPDDYESFADGDDLTGKVALMLRFEPMSAEGTSLWSRTGAWSSRAGFNRKMRAIEDKNPAAVIVVNVPGADDPRINELIEAGGGGRAYIDGPVVHVSMEAGDELLASIGAGVTLADLRDEANVAGGVRSLGGEVHVLGTIEETPLVARNVAGILPGKGALANEIVVMGAHLDHLGTGQFGSRGRAEERGQLHPGADDNASGSAAVLMLADKLAAYYAELGPDADARTLMFMGFSAEESGLNGSFHYVRNPIEPIEDHVLMLNFDMIGRITNKRLSVSGSNTGVGMNEWLQPLFEESSLEIVQPANMSGASDHTPFYQQEMPVLFAIIADFHDDYHTPRDISQKINRVDAVETIYLFENILRGAATRPQRFEFQSMSNRRERPDPREVPIEEEPEEAPEPQVGLPEIKVRFGIAPATYEDSRSGILVGSVTEGTSAHDAGVVAGDRLIKWNGDDIDDVMSWMGMLADHEPDDRVQVTVLRDDEEVVLWVTLKGREDGEG